MFKTSSTAGPIPSLEILDQLARKSGLIIRKSLKFSSDGFLLALIQSVISGKSSLNQMALRLGRFQPASMSRQGLHQRFNVASSGFLLGVLGELLKKRTQSIISLATKRPFKRLLIEDCTVMPVHKSNHEAFPGNGNGLHQTAGVKIHLLTDWLSGDVLESALYTARSADQGLCAEVLLHCRKGDLIIRDMGFFHFQTLQKIESKKAFWLSRLPASVTAYDTRGKSLDTHLKKETRKQFEMVIYMGRSRQNKCRLVATRLSKTQAEKNRRDRRRNSKKHGTTPNKRGLLRDGWSILVTNLTKTEATPKLLHELYSLRWSIEIQFRGVKQSCCIEKALGHKADHYQLEALMLAAMIYQILTLRIHAALRRQSETQAPIMKISYEKLCDALAMHTITLTRQSISTPFTPDKRHLKPDRRKRKTLYSIGFQALT